MHVHVAAAAKFARDGGDMKRARRFVLQFHVFHRGVFARKNFRDRIGEIGGGARVQITFHHRQFAVGPRDESNCAAESSRRRAWPNEI